MPTLIELISPRDTIVFAPDPSIGDGWVYNNETLTAWYSLPKVDAKRSKRPNAHGAFGLGQTFTGEHLPVISGQFYGYAALDALVARNRINAMYAEGVALTMRVIDELGPTTRTVWLLEASTDFHHDFAHFPFDIALVAPDPRRYGPTQTETDGMPSGGSGLVWDLGTSGTGLFFDWGSAGVLGQVSFYNSGNAATLPRIEVGGPGAFAAGFRLTEIETGRELIFERATGTGDVIVFDSRTQRATLAAGDVTAFLSSRDWFRIPAGVTRRYQINPLGGVTGSPTMTIYAAPANL